MSNIGRRRNLVFGDLEIQIGLHGIPIYPLQKESLFAAIPWGYKNNKTEQNYPQFQNAVGTLPTTSKGK